jgi:hypothetical protein
MCVPFDCVGPMEPTLTIVGPTWGPPEHVWVSLYSGAHVGPLEYVWVPREVIVGPPVNISRAWRDTTVEDLQATWRDVIT